VDRSVDNSGDWFVLFVPGRPAPQGSKTYLGNGRMRESSRFVKGWRADIVTMAAFKWGSRPPLGGPVELHLDFVMPRPSSLPKRKPTPPAVKRPDWDKLSRAVCDALTSAQVYRDDSQVTIARVTKRIAEQEEKTGVWIHIREAQQ
jgi:crossover junction endodeoxyribonuclease RusA